MIYVYFGTFALFSLIFSREVVAPASGASCDKRWRIMAGAMNASNFIVVIAAGYFFQNFISKASWLNLQTTVDPITGGAITFLASSFIFYWWHRLIHKSDTLWRLVHQLHHSPNRIEALTTFYVHPLDSLTTALLNAFVAYSILGVGPVSAAIAMMAVTIFSLVAHADLRTPRLLGLFIQRPEMHRVHHELGVHKSNYGLPLWDILFGTWKNPKQGPTHCGFDGGKPLQIKDMLLFRDVNK